MFRPLGRWHHLSYVTEKYFLPLVAPYSQLQIPKARATLALAFNSVATTVKLE